MNQTRKRRKKKLLGFGLLFLCLCFISANAFCHVLAGGTEGENGAAFQLTQEEEAYLQKMRMQTIVFGVSERSAYCIEEETEYGTLLPVLWVFREEFGLEVEVVSDCWTKNRERLWNKELDFLYGIPAGRLSKDFVPEGRTLYRTEWLHANPMRLIALKEAKISENTGTGFKTATLGLLDGFCLGEGIAPYLGAKKLLSFASEEEMLMALHEGEIDMALVAESSQECLFADEELEVAVELSRFLDPIVFGAADEKYEQLIALFNRYMLESLSEDSLREKIQAEKQRFLEYCIWTKEADAIRAIREEYETIAYALSTPDSYPFSYQIGQERDGIWEDLLSFIAATTGIRLEKEGSLTGSEAAAALDENRIQILAGWIKERKEWGDAKEGEEEAAAFKALRKARLVAAVSSRTLPEKEQIQYIYWGATEDAASVISGTAFDGRTIVFESDAELQKALEEEEIGGILLKDGRLDFRMLDGRQKKYLEIKGISIPVWEGMAYNKSNGELNRFLNRMVHIYQVTHPNYEKEQQTAEGAYGAMLQEAYEKQGREMRIWKTAALGLLAACVLLAAVRRQGKGALKKRKKASTGWDWDAGSREEWSGRAKRGSDLFLRRAENAKRTPKEQSNDAAKKPGATRRTGVDALTGLAGEHSCRKEIGEIISEYPQAQAAFAYLDLRKLRDINHTYGYRTGDEVLVSFAESLKTLELDKNTVVFRVDGDKFGAFRGNLESEMDYRMFLGELQSLSAQAHAQEKLICAAYSCGLAVYRKDAEDIKGLAKCADAALRYAKRKSRSLTAWEEIRPKKMKKIFLKN